ncbi:hypothetical protein ACUUL3_14300 [Thiovibrio sp. JS02]
MPAILYTTGLVLAVLGFILSVAFWIPRLVNRVRLKEILGPKYPLIFFVYLANGPFLMALGLILAWKFH